MRTSLTAGVLALIVLLSLVLWWLPNRPVALDPLPGGKLQSVSFAPFRDGQSPLTGVYPTEPQIDRDLMVLKSQVAGVRTYTSQEGLEVVPKLAEKHGLKVTMGAWLSKKLDNNEKEVRSLVELANAFPETITRVIVGNEVLLRKELTPAQLMDYLHRVRQSIKQPVSYADVWEFWLKHPEVAQEVDFITIHLLPYWEDDPQGVERTAEHILWSYNKIRDRFPDKPILVGEVGWPTAGRTRGPAVPGVVNKARFDNIFINTAVRNGFDYNLIEAFDQNWKIKLEGTVGGKWGYYTADRKAKYPVAGPVVENPLWPIHFGASTGLAVAALMGVIMAFGPPLPLSGFAVIGLLALGLGSAFVRAGVIALDWNYYWIDFLQDGLLMALQAAVAMAIIRSAAALWMPPEASGAAHPLPLRAVPALLRRPPGTAVPVALWGYRATVALAAIAVVWSALLIVDGRYRDFPAPYYMAPALGLLALAVLRVLRRPAGVPWLSAIAFGNLFDSVEPLAGPRRPLGAAIKAAPVEAFFTVGLIAGAVGVVIAEGPVNTEAVQWAILQIALALPFAASLTLAVTGSARTAEHAQAA